MTLILNNDDVKQDLNIEVTMAALDTAWELARQEAVCRPRIDIQIPTHDPNKIYQWGTMEGSSTLPIFRNSHEIGRDLPAGIPGRDHPGKFIT
jgi:hypothetical protein